MQKDEPYFSQVTHNGEHCWCPRQPFQAVVLNLLVTADRSTLDNCSAARECPMMLLIFKTTPVFTLCTQQCFHGKNRPITYPESKWFHHQYTCKLAAKWRSLAWRL